MSAPAPAPKAPRAARFGWFLHLLARRYQDYEQAVYRAHAHPGSNDGLDVDAQQSKDRTGWALHWPTVGQNKLHDPDRRIGPKVSIVSLTDAQIGRLRGPNGQEPHKLSAILRLCEAHQVRAEVEVKVRFDEVYVRRLMARPYVKAMDARGDLQVKTLAKMGDPVPRLRVFHDAGATTILSFTGYRGPGISKARAWPVTDYVRGRGKWTT